MTRDKLALVLVGAVLVALTAFGPAIHFRFGGMAHWGVVGLTAAGAAWAAYAAERVSGRFALWTIALVAVAMRLSLLFVEPYLSDDIYRYIWDGRVQAAGINPFRYVPAAPELEALRDTAIYPLINRADYAPTMYPPTAQIFFLAVTRLGESVLVMKLAILACEALAIGATLSVLARLGLPATRIAAFAWHPLAVWEIAGSGHLDALMLGLMMLGVAVYLRGRTLLAGVLVTSAALAKPMALLALPVFWRPWNLALPAVFAATIALLYLPYLSVGSGVFGFLGGYLAEEEFTHGHGFRYLLIVEQVTGKLPDWVALVYATLAAAVMAGLALRAGFRTDRSAEASVAHLTLLVTAFMLLLTPHYPWYYLVLAPFVAIYPWSLTLWVLSVGSLQMYHAVPGDPLPDFHLRQVVFHLVAIAAVVYDYRRIQRLRLRNMPAT